MNASVFRDKISHAGYLPSALVHYLVSVADTLEPEARERIAGKINAGADKLMTVAAKAAEQLTSLEKSAKKKR